MQAPVVGKVGAMFVAMIIDKLGFLMTFSFVLIKMNWFRECLSKVAVSTDSTTNGNPFST